MLDVIVCKFCIDLCNGEIIVDGKLAPATLVDDTKKSEYYILLLLTVKLPGIRNTADDSSRAASVVSKFFVVADLLEGTHSPHFKRTQLVHLSPFRELAVQEAAISGQTGNRSVGGVELVPV